MRPTRNVPLTVTLRPDASRFVNAMRRMAGLPIHRANRNAKRWPSFHRPTHRATS